MDPSLSLLWRLRSRKRAAMTDDGPLPPRSPRPRGFIDRRARDLAAERQILAAVSAVYERYGFEALDTGAFEYADALGKFLPDADRPNEGVFALQDDDEQWMALRYDLTAPLARFVAAELGDPAQAVPPLRLRPGLAQREARARPLPRVHRSATPTRWARPGPRPTPRSSPWRAEALEAAGLPAGGECVKINNRKLLNGLLDAAGVADARARSSPCCAPSTSSTGWAWRACGLLLGEGRKDESGDFTKGAGLTPGADRARAGLRRGRRRRRGRDPRPPRQASSAARPRATRGWPSWPASTRR